MLTSALANSVVLMFIPIINHVAFFKAGSVHYTYSSTISEIWLGAMMSLSVSTSHIP